MIVPHPPAGPTRPRRAVEAGFTLVELATVLLLVALTVPALLPAARDQADRLAVLGAREEVAGMVARARSFARTHGGADLVGDTRRATLVVEAGGAPLAAVDLGLERGVEMVSGGRAGFRLRFGPMGLGRAASRTIELRRGDAAAVLTVSSYGRIRRW